MQNINRYNTSVIDKLKSKYGVSRRFITQSLTGDRKSETSDSIKKDYKELLKKVEEALK